MTQPSEAQDPRVAGERQPTWFLVAFAMAVGGGAIAYVPLLTVLLPLQVSAVAAPGDEVAALAQLVFYGAVVASVSNIVFGYLSDLTRTRWPWIASGMVASSALLIAIGNASTIEEMRLLIILWQAALNMMLGPLFAWAGDCFPDSQKGVLGGAFAVAPAMGALAGSLATFEGVIAVEYRLELVAVLVIVLVLPVLIFGRSRVQPVLMEMPEDRGEVADDPIHSRSTVMRMWVARFLVQIAEAGLFAFLLYWLRSLSEGFHENNAANIFSVVLVVSVPLALWIGRWSDRSSRPILPLWLCAGLASAGLLVMALSSGLLSAIAGYVLFAIGASVFLSLHTGQTLRVLPRPHRRGRDMGLFNLTNTVPSLVMPWMTLALVPSFGFTALFALFAALSMLAALLLLQIERSNTG